MKYVDAYGERNYANINWDNQNLVTRFFKYLKNMGRAEDSIKLYRYSLRSFFIWNKDKNDDKDFVDITEDDFLRFQKAAFDEFRWSSSVVRYTEGILSSLSTFIAENLQGDHHYAGYKNIIKNVRIPRESVKSVAPVYTEDQLLELLDMLTETERYKEACLIALIMYSGRHPKELIKLAASDFDAYHVYMNGLYKILLKDHYIYVLKEKFDPFLALWFDYRKEHMIKSKWLFPDFVNYEKSWNNYGIHSLLMECSSLIDVPFVWESVINYALEEFVKADLPYTVCREMAGMDKRDMIAKYVGNRKEKRNG